MDCNNANIKKPNSLKKNFYQIKNAKRNIILK